MFRPITWHSKTKQVRFSDESGIQTPTVILLAIWYQIYKFSILNFTSFLSFVVFHILIRNSFHSIDLYFDVASGRNRIGNLVYRLLVDLHAVDGQARTRVKLLVTNVTFKVFGFLVLNQNFLVIEFSVTIPAKEICSRFYIWSRSSLRLKQDLG